MTSTTEPTARAAVRRRYGAPDTIVVTAIARPEPAAGEVVVHVHRASVNPLDWHMLTGLPYFMRLVVGVRRPKQIGLGADFAGVVVAVAADVDTVAVGDRVFGAARGSFADFAIARAATITRLAEEVSDDDAAALPVAAVTALQAVRDHARVGPASRVLINGAAGGVGTCAVQLAVAAGAHVTAVCSERNVEMVRGLGAHTVIDYTAGDAVAAAAAAGPFDAILDNVGNWPLREVAALLTGAGTYVMISGPKHNRLLGPAARLILGRLRFAGRRRRFVGFTASETSAELDAVLEHVVAGRLRPVIDRHYPLDDVAAAVEYVATGHARAKVIVDVS